jgi:PTS system beta-glucosides-specific IIC component
VLPVFFKEGHMAQFLGFLLSIGVAFTLGVIFLDGGLSDRCRNKPTPAADIQSRIRSDKS